MREPSPSEPPHSSSTRRQLRNWARILATHSGSGSCSQLCPRPRQPDRGRARMGGRNAEQAGMRHHIAEVALRRAILGFRDAGWLAVIGLPAAVDRKSTRLNSSHANISYAVFCLKKKKKK